MQHILDVKQPDAFADFENFIEEINVVQARASTSDCLSTASSFSCSTGTAASFSSVGSVVSTGGGGGGGGGCNDCHQ